MFYQQSFEFSTRGRGTYEVTEQVVEIVRASGIRDGLGNLFIHHTSASLIACENADPSVRRDLERYIARLVPDGDPIFEHAQEGIDDMPAHVRSILTQTSINFPVRSGSCDLGTWQGLYLWEHRSHPHRRRLTVSVVG